MELHLGALFSEPKGWEGARIFLAGSLVFFALYGTVAVLSGEGDPTALVFGVGNGMAGVAELLPERRQRWVSALRTAAIGVFVLVLVEALFRLLA